MKPRHRQLTALFLVYQCHVKELQGAALNSRHLSDPLMQSLARALLMSAHTHLCDGGVHLFPVLTLAPQAGSNQLIQFQLIM